MEKQSLIGLSPLWIISLALTLGTCIVVMIPFAISGGETVKSSDWIGFAGSIVSGAMTIIAALIAWFAVQQQIDAQREQARATLQQQKDAAQGAEAEAKFAAGIVLTQPVQAAVAVFVIARQISDMPPNADPLRKFNAKKQYDNAMNALSATMSNFAIAQAWQQLGINERANYLMITSTLHTLITLHNHPTVIEWSGFIRNQLSAHERLHRFVRAFDAELADSILAGVNS